MEEKGTFDSLVSDLRQNEKEALLEKIQSHPAVSSAPLNDEALEEKPESLEDRYFALPLFLRMWYWLLGLFSGRPPVDMYLNALISSEGRHIRERYPGIFDYEQNLLQHKCRQELQNLKEASRFFYAALDSSFQRDKGAFFGYLGSLTMPKVHENLVHGSDPDRISAEHPAESDSKLRAQALEFIESKLNSIPEGARDAMYENSRSLFLIKTLSSFLFDRLLMSFTHVKEKDGKNEGGENAVCLVTLVRAQLIELANILYSFKTIPPPDVLSSLFVFSMAEQRDDGAFHHDAELQLFLQKAERSLDVIRNFNKNIPLAKIIRCACRDFSWKPQELSGGEDWFLVYKSYWLDLSAEHFSAWIQSRKNAELLHSFTSYFDGAVLIPLESAASEENPDGMPLESASSLSFLLTFHKQIFMADINTVIRPILVDGDFYKKENRAEFLEAYNIIIKLDDEIKQFNASLSPSGEYGKLWMQIAGDLQSIPVRRRKTQTLLDEVHTRAGKIIDEAKRGLFMMQNVLAGIINHDETSPYDTLANFAKLAGKGSTFTDGLNRSIQNIKTAINIIEDIREAAED
jgi:hypothetical protein